jgi:TRAP-type transport system periplasmic protein
MLKKSMAVLLGILFMFAAIPAVSVLAQDKVAELVYASPYAPTHPYSVADIRVFEKIEKETKGAVKFKPYWNGTLISSRESMSELKKGVGDMAFVTPIYEKSGVDLTKAILDFFSDSNPQVNAKIYWELYNKFPEIRKEYESVKVLAVTVGIPMYLMTTKKAVKSLEDMKGMRIRVTGDAMMRSMKALGAEPVGMPVTDMYESLQKGLIGGVIFAHGDYKSLKLAEVVKFETENFTQDRGVYVSRAMNKDKWALLPANVQKVFDANRDYWGVEIFTEQGKPEDMGKDLATKANIQFVKMDNAGIKKYSDILEKENEVQAQELEKRGFPGTKIYKEARRLVKLYNKKK